MIVKYIRILAQYKIKFAFAYLKGLRLIFYLFSSQKKERKRMEKKTEREIEYVERERKTVAAVRKGLKCHLFFCLNGGTRVFSTLQMSPFFLGAIYRPFLAQRFLFVI